MHACDERPSVALLCKPGLPERVGRTGMFTCWHQDGHLLANWVIAYDAFGLKSFQIVYHREYHNKMILKNFRNAVAK
jgi:hypothetical protein